MNAQDMSDELQIEIHELRDALTRVLDRWKQSLGDG